MKAGRYRFGDDTVDITAETAFREGMINAAALCDYYGELPFGSTDDAWLASEARKRVNHA